MLSSGRSVWVGYGDRCRMSVCEAHPCQGIQGWVIFVFDGRTEYAMGLGAMTGEEWEGLVESFVMLGVSGEHGDEDPERVPWMAGADDLPVECAQHLG